MEQPDRCAEPAHFLSLAQARLRIRAAISPIEDIERVPLTQAQGRVLGEDIVAPLDLPPFPNAAMDGYALRSKDLNDRADLALTVVGTSFAGRPFTGKVETGQTVRIFTGAAIPMGADAVVMQESVVREGDGIRLLRPVNPGQNIRPAGDDVRAGARLLDEGKRLTPADLGLLASVGMALAPVKRKACVAFFSTGDELRPVEEPLAYGEIHDGNRYILHALLDHPCIQALDLGIVPDDPAALKRALSEASRNADAVVTSGGVSVGEADFVTASLAELGRTEFWRVGIKPGKPLAFGRIGSSWFFGLPGNPVAVMVTFRQILQPALQQLTGAQATPPLRLKAVSRSVLRKSPGRMEFQRGLFSQNEDGAFTVVGCEGQGSHQLLGMSRANCFIVLPEENAGVKPGDIVEIEPFIECFF